VVLIAAMLVLAARPALAQDQSTLDNDHPTETMEQSATEGEINGVPTAPAQFLTKPADGGWRISEIVGLPVQNAGNETVGEINDLVTDGDGKVVAVIIGVGGFLGIGQKDVAVRFRDIRLSRGGDGGVRALANLSKDALAAAPAFGTSAAGARRGGGPVSAPQ
jgi:PRC-barrel domain